MCGGGGGGGGRGGRGRGIEYRMLDASGEEHDSGFPLILGVGVTWKCLKIAVPMKHFKRVGRTPPPQKPTQLSPRSHPRHLVGKRTAQKDTTIDITNDSQVNSNFPYKWSPASLTFNNYFYLFLNLYISRLTINNNTPHLKSSKNQNRRAALGRPAGGGEGGGGAGN